MLLLSACTSASEKGVNPANKNEILTLSEKNTVVLNMPIMGSVATNVSKELLEKSDELKAGEPLYLVLDTPGGSIDDGLKIVEVAKSLPRPVHTVSLFNASMGFVISQNLGDRYVISSSTMMSHRATIGGITGNFPGSFISRVKSVADQLMKINAGVAERAGMDLNTYLGMIANELWMGPEESIKNKFADKVVTLRCDKTLRGPGKPKELDLGLFSVRVRFNKCPLIKEAEVIRGEEAAVEFFNKNKADLVEKYGFIYQ
jgi:ATP-dependent protease ClpP protease subunit